MSWPLLIINKPPPRAQKAQSEDFFFIVFILWRIRYIYKTLKEISRRLSIETLQVVHKL